MANFYYDRMESAYFAEDVNGDLRKTIRDGESRGVYDPSDPQRGRTSEKWHDLYGCGISGYKSTLGTELDIEGGTDCMFNVVEDLFISAGKKKIKKATLNLDWTNQIIPSYAEKFSISGKKKGTYLLIGSLHLKSYFGEKDVILAVRLDNGVAKFKKAPVVVFQSTMVCDNQRSSAIEIDNLGSIAEAIVNSPYKHLCFSYSELSLL